MSARSSHLRTPITLLPLAALCAGLIMTLGACGGDGGNSLKGPASYDLLFDRVVVQRQESGGQPVAMIVKYEKDNKSGVPEVPAKVVANFPIQVDQAKDLVAGGSLSRTMQKNYEFPDMIKGTITFDNLNVGSESCGKFFITFDPQDGGGTLNGEFCANVELLAF
jgi:hypothetical protein